MLIILLHIDLCQGRQSGICGTGCSNWVNRKTAHVGDHVNHGPEGRIGVMKLYIHRYPRPDSQLVGQAVKKFGDRSVSGQRVLGSRQRPVKNLSSSKQRRKHWIWNHNVVKKSKYSSPPTICVNVLRLCLCLSVTQSVSVLSSNKDNRLTVL